MSNFSVLRVITPFALLIAKVKAATSTTDGFATDSPHRGVSDILRDALVA
jgi:hypothetical protein